MHRDVPVPSRSFVLGLADDDGVVDGGALYELATAVGFSDTKTRLTVRRLSEAGLIDVAGRGRSSTIRLTTRGLAERRPDLAWTAYAYRADAGRLPWDGCWHLVSFEIPEANRVARDALRESLVQLFGASLTGGLYVSASQWEPWVHAVADDHGVRKRVSTFSTGRLDVGGVTDPSAIARKLWPLGEIEVEAAELLEQWSPNIDSPPADLARAAQLAFSASAELERLLRADPLLPQALLPAKWSMPLVRRAYLDLIGVLGARHGTIGRAGVFTAFTSTIERTAAIGDEEFAAWLWEATRPGPAA